MSFEDDLSPFEEVESGINLFVYADNGTGKTKFIAGSPGLVILNADPGGVMTARSIGAKGVYKDIKTWDDLDVAEDFFQNDPAAKKYKWVWLDSISLFQDVGLEDIMNELIKTRSHRKVYHPDKGEYGENMNRLKLFIRHMVGLPINFGVTAYPFRYEDPETAEVQYLPWVQGKGMPNTVCGLMNVIGYMRIQKIDGVDHQVMYFKKKDLYYAKDRFGALPAKMIDPTVPKIQGLIEKRLSTMGGGTRPTKKVAKRAPATRNPRRPIPPK